MHILEKDDYFQPIATKSHIPVVLHTAALLAKVTVAALEAFRAMELHKFDALVGENACQYRACRINDLALLYINDPEWRKAIERVHLEGTELIQIIEGAAKAIERRIPSNKEFKIIYPQGTTAERLCQEYGLSQSIPEPIAYLVQSYLLTQTKVLVNKRDAYYQKDDVTSVKELAQIIPGGLGKNKLASLVSTFQKDLAASSLSYLRNEADLLDPTEENSFAQEMIMNQEQRDEFSRPCIPCFYGLESLVQRIAAKNQLIMIDISRWESKEANGALVDRIKLLYQWENLNRSWVHIQEPKVEKNQPVVVIGGYTLNADQSSLTEESYVKRFNSYPLERILNANWAQHTQYPGKKLADIDLPSDQRRLAFAKDADAIGCSSNNKSLFMVNHILCDTYQHAHNNKEML